MMGLVGDMAYDRLPRELVEKPVDPQNVDLYQWSLLARNSDLIKLAKRQTAAPDEGSILALVGASTQREEEKLKNLDLRGAILVTDVGLSAVAKACESLTALNLEGCIKLTDDGLRTVALHCTALLHADLTGCTSLDGTGVAALGSGPKHLRTLKLKGISSIVDWMLLRIAKGCEGLQYLDLDGCTKITDDGIKAVAHHCVDLEVLHINGCTELSDIAILEVSKCRSLKELEMRRKTMQFKISDVGLLALAERCSYLTSLDLCGCTHITDVGLMWLAQGCHALRHLNLSGLERLSDAGLLSLCEGCALLETINLRGAAKISDIGMAHLGNHCHSLKSIVLAKLFLLTDAKQKDFGFGGLPAIAQGSGRTLRKLDITGCFQVSVAAFTLIAKHCKGLRAIIAVSCPKVNGKAVAALVKGCRELRLINLKDCPRVTADSIVEVGKNCRELTSLDLSKCERVDDRSIAALARGCPYLKTLKLNGCVKVGDLGLLALSQARMADLEELQLRGLAGVSETGVSWIANDCPSVMKLNIMGCSITASGTSTLHMQWDHVAAKKTKDWFGIWPKDRAADRRFIDEYGAVWDAAIKIQNACRTKRSRREMAIKRELALQKWVARTLQSFWRGRQGRREAIVRGMQRNIELEAAMKLQGAYRHRKAMGAVALKRQQAEDRRRVYYATLIEARIRGRNARRLADKLWDEREKFLDECERLALKLQSAWRGRCGRVAVSLSRAAAAALAVESEKAASQLQQIYRGRLARQEAASRRVAKKDDSRRREEAAITLQCAYRGRSSQKNMWRRQMDIAKLHKSVVMVQSAWRSKQGRFAGFLLAKAKEDAEADVAARSLQKMFRHHKSAKLAKLKGMFRKERANLEDWAVRKLQNVYRGKAGRDFAKKTKQGRKKDAFEGLRLEEWAAITMQRAWRGYLGRKRAAMVEQKMAESWKEMWDEEKKRFFFYNMRTGEIRWRKPQILLDMLEQPVCDNCSYYSATMECHFCGEFFCQEVSECLFISCDRMTEYFTIFNAIIINYMIE